MKQSIAIIAALIAALLSGRAEEKKQIVDLRGTWKFEIGDNKQWSDPKFDDSKWDDIFVPADWENEGFPGYDGYAWYRKSFTLPSSAQNKTLYFHVLADDVCAVYINGNLIGEGGSFPPHYESFYNVNNEFFIPTKFLRFGQQNVVAVRVYDSQLHGGIVSGKVGVFEHKNEVEFVVTLPEFWKLKKGDEMEWKEPNFDDSKWQDVFVPAKWDFQGYREYDGFMWYRVTFNVSSSLKDDNYVLMLGKVDDIDETYLNGELIGRTGRIRSDGSVRKIRDEWTRYRGYRIPSGTLKPAQKNVLAVRVFDHFSWGGIYEGPIGIVKERDFRQWETKHFNDEDTGDKFQKFIDKIFNDD